MKVRLFFKRDPKNGFRCEDKSSGLLLEPETEFESDFVIELCKERRTFKAGTWVEPRDSGVGDVGSMALVLEEVKPKEA
jgi:hypothetical protein